MHIQSRTGIGILPPSTPFFLSVAGDVNFTAKLVVGSSSIFKDLLSLQLVANTSALETRVPADANPLFSILRDGTLAFGAGGASPQDITIYRASAALIRTSGSLTVDINFLVSGNATVTGNLVVNGNTTIGNATSDTVTVTATVSSSLVPTATNTSDLGLSSLGWRDLFVLRNGQLGSTLSDSLAINAAITTNLVPSITNAFSLGQIGTRWAALYLGTSLNNAGSTVLGTTVADTLAINAGVSTSILPSVTNTSDLGSASLGWKDIYADGSLSIKGNTTLGDATSDTITTTARFISSLVPSVTNTYDLGTSLLRWGNIFAGGSISMSGDLSVLGNTTLGDANTDTLTVNARIASDLIPSLDNTYDLGSSALRWKTLHVGPSSLIVHNDATDTQKVSVGYQSGNARYAGDATSKLVFQNGSNQGFALDTAGLFGVNKTTGLAYQLDVNGTVGANDTIFANKASGIGIFSESKIVAKSGVEADVSVGVLNIGSTSDTQFVNMGTSSAVQTVNIGTGSGQTVINIGGASDIVNIAGTAVFVNTINSVVSDKTFTLNAGGSTASGASAGIYVEEAAAVLLVATDALWQSGNIVRYLMASTGNIAAGSTVTITGFSNGLNNGTFSVSAFANNVSIDVVSTRTNASLDQSGASASVTNPTITGYVAIAAARNAWSLVSPIASGFAFNFKNLGSTALFTAQANTDLELSIGGAFVPATSGQDFGSTGSRWDLFGAATNTSSLIVNANSTLGTTGADTVTLNAVPAFLNGISTSLIPTTGILDLGVTGTRWRDLFISGSAEIAGALLVGTNLTTNLDLTVYGNAVFGDANTDTVSFVSRIGTDLIPSVTNTRDLGTSGNTWRNVYASTIALSGLTTGSALFAGASGAISQNNAQYFWNNSSFSLGLGTAAPDVQLHLQRSSSAPTFKMIRTDSVDGLGFFASAASSIQYTGSLLFSSVSSVNLATANAGVDSFILSSTGSFQSLAAFAHRTGSSVITNTYSISTADTVVLVDSSNGGITGNCTITLPSAATKRLLIIKDIGNNCAALNKNIILTPSSGQFVEFGIVNETFIIDSDGASLTLHSDGVSRWYIL